VCSYSWTVWRRIELDFQVNDETYFLSLADDERRWLVLLSTPTGARSIPVYVDAPESEPSVVLHMRKQRIPN
jgi:hypothetical protein